MAGMKTLCLFVGTAMLTACATYQPKPLDTKPSLPNSVEHLALSLQAPPVRSYSNNAQYRFDPAVGLNMTELAALAVDNNPDLKIARDDAGVSHAQAFSAGLLPDPQLALNRDLSNSGGPGSTTAFGVGLSYDISALLSHTSNRSAADADAQKADLNLLWQEWQVVSQARILYVKLTQAKKLNKVLLENRQLFSERLNRTQLALDKGLLTSDAVTPNLISLKDVQRQMNDLERQTNQNAHDLNALLGLAPEALVPLKEDDSLPAVDDAAIQAALSNLSQRRPDLLALEAGYRAEDARYRGALLAQFPALNIGFTRARDNSNVYSNGVGITLTLPFLNRNRGNVAIELATRQKMHDEYEQRLNASLNDLHRILDEQYITMRQLDEINTDLAKLSKTVGSVDQAYRAGNVDALARANMHAIFLSKQIEQVNLQQAVLEQRVALQTLIGGELPVQNPQSDKKP
jgi:outer membrane protein TolC